MKLERDGWEYEIAEDKTSISEYTFIGGVICPLCKTTFGQTLRFPRVMLEDGTEDLKQKPSDETVELAMLAAGKKNHLARCRVVPLRRVAPGGILTLRGGSA